MSENQICYQVVSDKSTNREGVSCGRMVCFGWLAEALESAAVSWNDHHHPNIKHNKMVMLALRKMRVD